MDDQYEKIKILTEALRSGEADPEEVARLMFPKTSKEEMSRTLKHAVETLRREQCGEISPETRMKFFKEKRDGTN